MKSHENYAKSHTIKIGSDRNFGFVIGGILFSIGIWPLIKGEPMKRILVFIGLALFTAAIVYPKILNKLNIWWAKLGIFMGKIATPIVMGILFFLVFTPLAMILRVLGNDFLRLKFAPESNTYWINREPPGPAGEEIKRQF